ncbi:MAG: helix-turn-helix transcriptional regulator [Saprospiraceae bacterium]|nr:helix-turn-helix transcriptional regulator [Saprospiraceae bacterium]
MKTTNIELQTLPLYQQRLISKAQQFVSQNLTAQNLSVPMVAQEIGISERQLFRLLKSTMNTTPNLLIQEIRLEKAKELLEAGEYATVSEVSYAVGYNRPDYFSDVFERRYGRRPKEYKYSLSQ